MQTVKSLIRQNIMLSMSDLALYWLSMSQNGIVFTPYMFMYDFVTSVNSHATYKGASFVKKLLKMNIILSSLGIIELHNSKKCLFWY